MPKSTPTCNSIINLMYRETTWANVAENASAAPFTDTYIGLHTANLTAATDSQAENETARLSAEWAARKREIEQPAPQQAPVAPPAIQPEPQSFLDGINVEYDISDVLAIDVEAPDSDLTAILAADVEGMDNGIEQALASIDVGVFDDDIESILMD